MNINDAIQRARDYVTKKKLSEYMTQAGVAAPTAAASGFPGFGIVSSAAQIPQMQQREPEPVEEYDPIYETGATLARSLYQAPAQVADALSFIFGAEAPAGISKLLRKQADIDYPSNAPKISSWADLGNASFSDILKVGLSESGQLPASMMAMAVPGSMINKALLPIFGRVAAASPKAASLIKYLGGVEEAAQFSSGWGAMSLIEGGGMTADMYDQTGHMPELTARAKLLPFAAAAGYLEYIVPGKILSRLQGKVPARIIQEAASKSAGKEFAAYIVDVAKDMGWEGGTEWLQTLLEESGVKFATGTGPIESITSTITDPDAQARGFMAGVPGSLGGGGMRVSSDIATGQVGKAPQNFEPSMAPAQPMGGDVLSDVKRILGDVPKAPPPQQQTLPEVVTVDEIPGFDKGEAPTPTAPVPEGKADVGGNVSPEEMKIVKMRKQVTSVWEGIGVTAADMDAASGELFQGKKFKDLTAPELKQFYDVGLEQIAQGNVVETGNVVEPQQPQQAAPPQNLQQAIGLAQQPAPIMPQPIQPAPVAPPQNLQQAIGKIQQPQVAVPPMEMAQRPQNLQQAIGLAQQPQIQAPQIQPMPTMQQPAQPMPQTQAVTQPIMEQIQVAPAELVRPEMQQQPEPQQKMDEAPETSFKPANVFGLLASAINKYDHADFSKPGFKPDKVFKNRLIKARKEVRAILRKRNMLNPTADTSLTNAKTFMDLRKIADMAMPAASKQADILTAEDMTDSEWRKHIKTEGYKADLESLKKRESDLNERVNEIAKNFEKEHLRLPEETGLGGDLSALLALDTMREIAMDKAKADPKNASLVKEFDRLAEERDAVTIKIESMDESHRIGVRRAEEGRNAMSEYFAEKASRQTDKQSGQKDQQPAGVVAPEETNIVPKDGWRTHLIKARDYANRLGVDTEASADVDFIVSKVDAFLGNKPDVTKTAYGSKNKIVSQSRYEELKKRFIDKTKNIGSGVDPELAAITIEMAAYHMEAGVRKFADFASKMISEMGEAFRPYLKSAYLGAKYFPGSESYRSEMDSEDTVNSGSTKTGVVGHEDQQRVTAPKTEETTTPGVGKAGDINIPALSDALMPTVESWLDNPMTNAQLKKIITGLGVDTNDIKYSHKLTQEAIEGAVVRVIRKRGLNSDQVLQMYQNQPTLDERTVTSIMNQAYSTPAPLSMMLVDAIGFDQAEGSVYEPTAGNGLLLSGIRENEDGTLHDYRLNELEKNRNDQLKSLFPAARITNQDAMEVTPERKVDLVMANPPFGSLKGVGKEPFRIMTSGEVETEFIFTKLDHAIAAKALQSMKDNGKAVLILGAELDKTDKAKSEITGQNARFMDYLYNQYNVTGHFELSGDLYKKQGAAWPVIVVTIEGKKSFPKNYVKSPKSVERAATWNEVKTAIAKIESGKYLTGEPRLSVPSGKDSQQTAVTGRAEVPDSAVSPAKPEGRPKPTSLAGAISAATGNKPEAGPIRGSRSDNEQAGNRIPAQPKTAEVPIQGGREPGPVSDAEVARQNTVAAGVVDTDLQSVHEPESGKLSIGALVPANLKNPMQRAMKSLVEKIDEKSVDEYVAHQLGYDNAEQMGTMLSAQQVDALGLAFYNFLNDKATIIADQTGVGKGRVAAAAIAWAVKNGYIPVFTTETAGLFNDIYRDLTNIKESGLVPFIMNADASMSDADGNIVHEFDKKKAAKVMKRMEAGDFSDFGPDGEYDYIAMTYSQVNTEGSKKMNALLKAPEGKIITVLDESHNAAGVASNQGENIAKLIDSKVSKGVMYLSATWSKTPEQMAIYHRAFGEGMSIDEINIAFERGGVAMQEMTVASMADKGAYVRREQSFANVEFTRTKTTTPREVVSETEKAEKTMDIVRDIISIGGWANIGAGDVDIQSGDVAAAFGDELDDKGNAVTASVDKPDSPFSQVHNYVGAFLTSLKADAAANSAIESIKKGIKPVIVIQNTMGSAIQQLIETGSAKIGEGFGGTFSDVLDMMLEKTLIMPVKNNFTGKKGSVKIPLESMRPDFQAAFKALKAKIQKTEFKSMPFSPIDYIANKIKQAGYSMGELTGRDKYLDYGDLKDGKPTLKMKEIGNQAEYRKNTINDFNNGTTDAFLFNVAGATGMSIHSSVDFKDQRQREMLILQPFGDINKFMQAIGRTHRVGEIVTEDAVTNKIEGKPATYGYPSYKYLQSSLAMEIRSGIALEKKMKSLNAQTSSNEKGHQSVADVDVMNKYGLAIMRDWLAARSKIMSTLDLDNNSTVEQITGRIAVLKQEEQEQFWQEVVKEYQAKIQQLDAAGENDLVATSYSDSNAKTLSKKLLYGQEGSLTAPPIYLEHMEMTMTGKPTSLEGARQRVEKGDSVKQEQIKQRDEYLKVYLDRKRDENAESIANGKDPSFNISTIQAYADGVKEAIAKLVPGTIVSNDKGVGIITDVYLDEFAEGSTSFPWNPSSLNIRLATPGTSGNLIFSLAAYRKDMYRDGGLLSDADSNWKNDYNQEFKKNSTKKVKRYILTGDLYRASMMSNGATAVKFQRDDGTFDFGWLQKSENDDAVVKPIKEPPIKLTEDDIKNHTPEWVQSSDLDGVSIRPSVQELKKLDGTTVFIALHADDGTPGFYLDIRKTNKKYAKSLYSNKELLNILKVDTQSAGLTETTINGKKYLQSDLLSQKLKVKVMLKVNEIVKSRGGALVNTHTDIIEVRPDLSDTPMTNPRRGSAGIINIFAEYTIDKALSVLESAYNFVSRGGGSLIAWLKTVAKDLQKFAAKAWKDARKLLTMAPGKPGLGRRGGLMSFNALLSNAKQALDVATEEGTKELPLPGTKELVTEVTTAAYELGKRDEADTAKKRKESQKRRTDEVISREKAKLASLKKKNTLDREAKLWLAKLSRKLPAQERSSLLRQIAVATTPKQIGEVLYKIDKLYEKVVRRMALRRFTSAIRGAKKLRPEFQNIADGIKGTLVKRRIVYESIGGILKYLNDNDVAFVPESTMAALETLQNNKPAQLSSETIGMISQVLESITYMSEQENKKIFADNAHTLAGAVKEIHKGIQAEAKVPVDAQGKVGLIRWFFDFGSMQYEAITEMLGETGRKLFYGDMREGERQAKKLWFYGRDALHATMKKMGLDPEAYSTTQWLEKNRPVNGVDMSRNEYMNLVASLKDPSTRKEIIRAGYKLKSEAGVTHSVTADQADLIVADADSKEMAVIDSMREFVNGRLRTAINDTWVALAGYEKALKDNYWPRTRDIQKSGVNKGYKQYAKTALEELGIFKERQTSKAAVVIGNALDVYQNHLKKSSTFAGLAIPIRNIEMAMGKGGVSEAMEERFGKEFVTRIEDQIQAAADLGSSGTGKINEVIAGMLRKVAVGFLGFNVRSALKQFGGLATAATEIDGRYLASSLNAAFDSGVNEEMFKYSPILRDRYDSTGAKLAGPEFDMKQPIAGNKEAWTRTAMKLLENCDKAVSQIIWSAAKKEIQEKQPGLKGADLMKAVAERAESIVSRTQNVTSILDMSGVGIESRKNALVKALVMFQSQGNSIYNIIRRAVRKYKQGEITGPALVGTLALATMGNAIWSSMIGNLVSGSIVGLFRGGGDDDEDKKKITDYINASETAWDIAQENMNMFYGGSLLSSVTRGTRRMINGEKTFAGAGRIESATESVLNNAIGGSMDILGGLMSDGSKLKSGKNEGRKRSTVAYEKGAIKLIVRGLMPLTGLPAFPVSEGIKLFEALK